MSGKEPDDKIQKITGLLEKGGTMLAAHHECGAPMFRFQGKTVCPVCDFREKPEIKEQKTVGIGQEPANEPKRAQEARKAGGTGTSQKLGQEPGDIQSIRRIIRTKIQDIAEGLEDENDLHRMKDKLECIEQGIKILKLLQE